MTKIDWAQALENVDGDRELLSDIVDATIEECQELLNQMDSDLASQDAESLGRHAHTFKGNLRLFGAPYPSALAEEIETLGNSGITAGCEQRVAKLRADSEELFTELRNYLEQDS